MRSITEKLSYCNVDKWIKKLPIILWGIPDHKWIENKCELESDVDKIAGQSQIIQSQNMIKSLRFFMEYPGF